MSEDVLKRTPKQLFIAFHCERGRAPMQPQQPPTDQNRKTWSGRFDEPVAELVKRYTASVGFDKRLAEFDIQGSLAHARMLHAVGVLSKSDMADIERGMAEILNEIRQGKFAWSIDLEDVHLNIEKRLTDLVGDAGKRLHTGRSRNDQVATDIRLYLRAAIDEISILIGAFQTRFAPAASRISAPRS